MNVAELGKLLYGYKITQCLYVAAKLNIADYIHSDICEISELAAKTSTNAEALYRVMRCLTSLGVFEEQRNKHFILNSAAQMLRSDSENSMKEFICLCGEELYQSAGKLLYSVKTGLPAFDHIFEKDFWGYLDLHHDKANLFHNAMQKGSEPIIDKIISNYDFSSYKTFVDVGGGKGHLLCTILAKYPSARGIVFDLPNANQLAQEYIGSVNLTDRCDVISGDFFQTIPKNADMYLLKVVLHDWDDQNARLILQNCRKAMHNNSKIFIIEKVVEDNTVKDMACLGDINMLVTVSGKERSLGEFEKLLQQANFKLTKSISTDTVFSIIEAEPA